MRVCRYGDTSYIKMRNHWLDEIPKGLLHIYDMQQKMECLLLNKLGIDYIFIFVGMGIQVMKKCEIIGLMTSSIRTPTYLRHATKDGIPIVK